MSVCASRLSATPLAVCTRLCVRFPHPAPVAPAFVAAQAPSSPANSRPEPPPSSTSATNDEEPQHGSKKATEKAVLAQEGPVATDREAQYESLRHALIRLPIAAAASAILAFRFRRRGTPVRQTGVVQTQIILAIVGAIVMLVVGVSLARAFGIGGAAGLIRYRAKIDDPKDAGVMLSTLALGLAAGVGLYLLVAFATAFVLGALWLIESIEPEAYSLFLLTVNVKDVAPMRPSIEQTLRHHHVRFELRSTSADDVCYEVKVPLKEQTDTVSKAIAGLDHKQPIEVKWEKEKT